MSNAIPRYPRLESLAARDRSLDLTPEDLKYRLEGYVLNGDQLRMLAALAQIYEREGVLTDGFATALADSCPDAANCWNECRDRISREATIDLGPGQDGSIFLPWVGEEYRPGGACVVGWNLNHTGEEWFTLLEEFVIADHDRARLGAGYRENEWHSVFAYRSLASALAIADSIVGVDPVDQPAPQALAAGMARIARAQAVKCAPLGDRSNPSPEMNLRCPERFLVQELEVLRPRALLVLGDKPLDPVVDAIERRGDFSDFAWTKKFRGGYGRGICSTPWGKPLTLFATWHPTYARWPSAHGQLVADLHDHPVVSTDQV